MNETKDKIFLRVVKKGEIEGVPYFGIERGKIGVRNVGIEWEDSTCQIFACDKQKIIPIARHMVENLNDSGQEAELVT